MKKILILLIGIFISFGISNSVNALSCSDEYKPICGKDGKTYHNSCYTLGGSAGEYKITEIAYEGECKNSEKILSQNTKEKANKSFENLYNSKILNLENGTKTFILERAIWNIKYSLEAETDANKMILYKYLEQIFSEKLRENYENSIKENISQIIPSGWQNYELSEINWENNNSALIETTNGEESHTFEYLVYTKFSDIGENGNIKYEIKLTPWGIWQGTLYGTGIGKEMFGIKYRAPKSWWVQMPEKGVYKIEQVKTDSVNNMLRFVYLPQNGIEEKEGGMIFYLRFYTLEEWEEQLKEGTFHMKDFAEVGNYKIVSFISQASPYEDEENAKRFDEMLYEANYILENMKVEKL